MILVSATFVCAGLASAQIAPEITISAPSDFRAVQGSTLQPLNFSATNLNGTAGVSFNLALTPGSVGTAPSLLGSLTAGQTSSFASTPNIGGLTQGQTMSFGLQATNANWNAPVTAATNIGVVANRLLTGTTSLSAGRHIAGLQPIGNVTLSGGSLADHEATRISVNSGGYAQFSNGLRLTSASGFTFNGAGQTHDLQLAYNGPTGNYSVSNFTLPGAGQSSYTNASGAPRQDFGGAWKTSAEYGNVFGETRTFTEENRAQWDALPGNDILWQRPGTSGSSSNDYIYKQEVVETAKPAVPSFRSATNATGVSTLWELARGDGSLVNERINPLISGETIQGSNLDLSGVNLTVSGTAVTNRSIFGGTINLGRRMVGAANQTITRSDNVTLQTFGGDDHRTRLSLGGFSLGTTGDAVTAVHTGSSTFTDGSHTASVAVTGNFNLDSSTQGRVTQTVNAGSFITGEGIAGESVQNNLQVGYTWNNVQNNQLYANNLLIIDSAARGDTRSYWTSAGRMFSTETHTAIGWTGDAVTVSGSRAVGMQNLGNRTVTAIAEGLVGETASASVSFNTQYAGITAAAFQLSHNGSATGPLTDGNIITLADTGSGIYQNKVTINGLTLAGSERLDYEIDYAGGGSVLNHGTNRTFTIDYTGNSSAPTAGQLGRVSRANLTIVLGEHVNSSEIIDAWGITSNRSITNNYNGNVVTGNFSIETRFEAPAAASGSSVVTSGTDFGSNGLTLANTTANTSSRFTQASSMELLDSETLNTSRNVEVEFIAIDDADPSVVAALESSGSNAASLAGVSAGWTNPTFVSDLVELSGLDGVLQVIQLGYDGTGDESGAQILWRYDYLDGVDPEVAWINAVLGNSNITDLNLDTGSLLVDGNLDTIHNYLSGMHFNGSYADYLADGMLLNPELGAWGVDAQSNKVWAVIDHNSSFGAAVPEPSGSLLIIVGFFGLAMRRNRP